MKYFRCKCGKLEAWSSMGVRACEGCPKCETTLATHPDDHRPIAPHDPIAQFNQNTGERENDLCRLCMIRLDTRTAEVPIQRPGPWVDLWEL